MYVSRLAFHTIPGKTHEMVQELLKMRDIVVQAGGAEPHVLRTHFASLGAPDAVFEQEAPDLATLESQLKQVKDGEVLSGCNLSRCRVTAFLGPSSRPSGQRQARSIFPLFEKRDSPV